MGMMEATRAAFALLFSGDAGLWQIIWVSLKTSSIGLALATPLALLGGYALANSNFRGRRILIWLTQVALSIPTVLIGLLLYMMLTRQGPLGELQWLFSQPGIIAGQAIIALPVLLALTLAAVQAADPRLAETAITLGASRLRVMLTLLHEVRFGVMAAIINGFGRVAKRLVDLRRNVLSFYSSPEEAVKLFRHNEIAYVYGNYGMQQVKELRAAGADVGYVIPQEGALAWLDCWVVSAGRKNQKLAEAWIDYMLEKNVSQALTEKQGLANTLTPIAASAGNERILWLEPVENPVKRKILWDRIISGDNFDN